jgi:drug/metabolite transporter (DMT)-like permease
VSASATHRLQILAAALLFSTGGAAIKGTDFSSWQVASFRSGIAALTVLLLVKEARRGWSWHGVPVSIAYAACMVLFVVANKLTTAANAIFLQSTAPLYILLLGPFLLKERIRRADVVFMAVVGLGLAAFFVEADRAVATAPNPLQGNIAALASGVCWALAVMGLRWLSSREGGPGNAFPTVVSGNAIAFLFCLPFALPASGGGTGDWASIVYLGVFQIAIAYIFLTKGIRHVPALEASTLLLAEPALNPLWALLVHDERPGAWALAGGATILGATLAKTWWDARATSAAARAGLPPAGGD